LIKNEIKKFPEDERIKIRLTALPNQPMTAETFYAVFCKTDIPEMKNVVEVSSEAGRLSAGDNTFQQFQSILAKVPISTRIEAACQVIVVPNDQ